jgi:hypothetical protein
MAQYTYIKELTVPADTSLATGTKFIKTWQIKNSGDTAWGDGFTLHFEKGTAMTDQLVHAIAACGAGDTLDISITMTAPNEVGTYWGDWVLQDANGQRFGDVIWTRIVVKKPEAIAAGSPNVEFVDDITIPDGTDMETGKTFDKVWRVRNTGNVTWADGFELVHVDGDAMTTQTVQDIPNALVGEVVDVAVRLTAPATPGNHISGWRFRSPSKTFFGERVFARIVTTQPIDAQTPVSAYEFVSDVTIDDDAEIASGTAFTKTWRVRNTGNTEWGAGYTLRFINGEPMGNITTSPLPPCKPGEEGDISISMTAPSTSGKHFGDWRFYDANGNPFGEVLWLRIIVPAAATTAPLAVTAPLGSPAALGTGSSGAFSAAPAAAAPQVEIVVQHYSQRDPRWQGQQLGLAGSNVTIGSWGCLMTSMTMFANWKGQKVTPPEFMALMIQRGGFFGVQATAWNALQTVYSDCACESNEPMKGGDLVSRINAYLDQKIPVITQVDRTPDSAYTDADTHWVLVVGRSGNNDYWVNDPIELEAKPTSLLRRYGRAGQGLQGAIVSILPYR